MEKICTWFGALAFIIAIVYMIVSLRYMMLLQSKLLKTSPFSKEQVTILNTREWYRWGRGNYVLSYFSLEALSERKTEIQLCILSLIG